MDNLQEEENEENSEIQDECGAPVIINELDRPTDEADIALEEPNLVTQQKDQRLQTFVAPKLINDEEYGLKAAALRRQ